MFDGRVELGAGPRPTAYYYSWSHPWFPRKQVSRAAVAGSPPLSPWCSARGGMATTVRRDEALSSPVQRQVEEQETTFTPISSLEAVGIPRGDIKKFQDAGYYTADAIVMTSARQLEKIKGLSEAKVVKAKEGASKVSRKIGFQTAGEMLLKRQREIIRITTGSSALDEILGGGIETGSITEIHGEWRTGKTQLALTLAVASLVGEEQGGGNGRTLYLDSENNFSPERLVQIADRFQLDHAFVMDNVHVTSIWNEDMYEETLKHAKHLISEEEVRLVIFDSIIGVFRFEYSGRGELSERQQKLGKLVYGIKKMASEYNVAVVFTNQMTADPGSVISSDAKKPVGGHVLAHLVDTRVYLRKGRGDQRIARIEDSPRLPMAEATFSITTGGIMDPTD